ncbi:MAG: type II secretion system F family protein [Coriobacteriia bacterium]|nr:type II secretion system F family protein [Coriobacteriia bacterium]
METVAVMKIVAAGAAFFTAAIAVPEVAGAAKRAVMLERASDVAGANAGMWARLVRNGIPPATSMAHRLMAFPVVAEYCRGLSMLASRRGLRADDARIGGVMLVAAALMLCVGWACFGSLLFGLMAACCLIIGAGLIARHIREREAEAMRESVPDILHAMSACFHSGYSLLQSFEYIAQEVDGPMGRLFKRAASDLSTGLSASDALKRMREESSLSELAFVIAALDIQHQTGGSLQKVIDSARDSIEGELALERSLRVQTAQARLSMRIVTIMPFVLIGIFSLVSPEFLAPFFGSLVGIGVLVLALGMQVAGVVLVRRLLDVGEV